MATNTCPCDTTIVNRTHRVGECEIYKERRDLLEEGMRKLNVCDVEELGRLESNDKTIAILGDRWWPQTAKQDRDRISKQFLCSIWKKRNERLNVGGVSIRSLRSVSKGMRGQWSNDQGKQLMSTPPLSPPSKYIHI